MTISSHGQVDKLTGANENIEYEHHEIHEGRMFQVCAVDTSLDTDGELIIVFRSPIASRVAHLEYFFGVTGAATYSIKRGVDPTIGAGVALTAFNQNEGSDKTSGIRSVAGVLGEATQNPTVGVQGIEIHCEVLGSGNNRQGGGSRGELEKMLRKNTEYMFRITSNSQGNRVSLRLLWYETMNNEETG